MKLSDYVKIYRKYFTQEEPVTQFKIGDRVEFAAPPDGTRMRGMIVGVMPDWDAWRLQGEDGRGYIQPMENAHLIMRLIKAYEPLKPCDCGGWSVGTHSSWCSGPTDNAPRPRGLVRRPAA